MDKIDFCITFVDGSDDKWIQKRNAAVTAKERGSEIRYRNWDTLKYWFRGVEKYASFVNKIYFITDGQVPEFINTKHEKLVIVNHSDFMSGEALPCFNSNVIEMNMHRIKGLSEQFVYFNDDMFILKKLKPTDFFKNSKPCHTAALSPVICYENGDFSSMELNNLGVINQHFAKNEVIKRNPFKWFNLKYKSALIKTLFLMPWRHFVGFLEPHSPNPFLKSTFNKVWEKEGEYLSEMNTHRVRDNKRDLSQWLIKNWQICEGNFCPKSPSLSASYVAGKDTERYTNDIKRKKHSIVCINDADGIDFDYEKQRLVALLENIFPTKSSFEKEI